MYGIVNTQEIRNKSQKTYLNSILVFANHLKCKIEVNLDKVLGEKASIAKRYITSEILIQYLKTFLRTLEQAVYIIF